MGRGESRGGGHGPERERKAHFMNFKAKNNRVFYYFLLRDNQCPSSLCTSEELGNLDLWANDRLLVKMPGAHLLAHLLTQLFIQLTLTCAHSVLGPV